MEYSLSQWDHSVCFRPEEPRLGAANAEDFRSALRSAIGDGEVDVVLDLSNIRLMDSTALGATTASLQLLKPGRSMYVCGVNDSVLSVLKLMRLDQVFRVVDSPEDARATIERERRDQASPAR